MRVNPGTLTPVAELAAGLDPQAVAVDDTGQRAYVANRGSDSISAMDLGEREVIAQALAIVVVLAGLAFLVIRHRLATDRSSTEAAH